MSDVLHSSAENQLKSEAETAATAAGTEQEKSRRKHVNGMTPREREELQRLTRQRERVLKSAAKQRSSELLADFENQMGSEYFSDQDPVWEQITADTQRVVDRAREQIARHCRELGIPDQFAPTLSLGWHHRGYGNVLNTRRDELRIMAKTRIEAIERKAITQIEFPCLAAQEQIALAGLTSEAARRFVEQLPSIEVLMPQRSLAKIAGEAGLPIAEQLVSSNALRQRRWRDKHRNAAVMHHNAVSDDEDEI
jgi:hypothetical protein